MSTTTKDLNAAVKAQAEEIVLHAMQREPANRYPTIRELKAELDAPEKVFVSGYCNRLQAPRWRMGFRETPILVGALMALGFIALQVVGFLVVWRALKR